MSSRRSVPDNPGPDFLDEIVTEAAEELDGQRRITHNVFALLVQAKQERNAWQERYEQMERERNEWAARCQQLVEAVEALQRGDR